MSDVSDLQARIEHPSPGRGRVSHAWLFAGLAGAPTAWVVQVLVDYGLSSNACTLTQGRHGQQPVTGFGAETSVLMGVNVACLVVAVAAGVLSWRHWRATQQEKGGGVGAQLSIGEGRTRFLAIAGMMAAFAFGLATLFGAIEPLLIPSCWSFR